MCRLINNTGYVAYISWVKNVNNLSVRTGTTSGVLSPDHMNTIATHPSTNGQLVVIHQFVPDLYQTMSTVKITMLYLLSAVYTHNPQYLLIEPIKKI